MLRFAGTPGADGPHEETFLHSGGVVGGNPQSEQVCKKYQNGYCDMPCRFRHGQPWPPVPAQQAPRQPPRPPLRRRRHRWPLTREWPE